MKYLIMTEGSGEKAVLDVFIEKGILKYKKEGKYKVYNKNKHMKPSEYLVNQVLLDYQKTYKYNYNYFLKMNVEEIRRSITEYNVLRHETHQSEEYTLDYLIDKI